MSITDSVSMIAHGVKKLAKASKKIAGEKAKKAIVSVIKTINDQPQKSKNKNKKHKKDNK